MKIAIYQTSDLHGYMYPTNYVKEMPLGYLRVASFIESDRKRYDGALKIDCGDLIQGSALASFFHKTNTPRNPLVTALLESGTDVMVLGNHEFNYGLPFLTNSYAQAASVLLNANIHQLPFESKPYRIFTFGGYRIGCVGVTTKFIPVWEQRKNIEGLEIEDPLSSLERTLPKLADCDCIICCYHGGFEKSIDGSHTPTERDTGENQASAIMEKFPQISIMLCGHQHRNILSQIDGRVYAQPKSNGESFTKIVLDTETGKMEAELISTAALSDRPMPALEKIFQPYLSSLESFLNTVAGHFESDLRIQDVFAARLYGHPMVFFLHEMQLHYTGADFSELSLFDTAIGFKRDVTIRDILMNYPFPNTLCVLEVSGRDIRQSIEKSLRYFVLDEKNEIIINKEFLIPKVQSYNYDLFYGMEFTASLSLPLGSRLLSLTKNGKPIEDEKRYTVAMSNYRATTTTAYPWYEGKPIIKEIPLEYSELIMNYLKEKPCYPVISQSNFRIQKDSPLMQ